MKRSLLLAVLLLVAATAAAAPPTLPSTVLLARAWPDDPSTRLADVGQGIGVVFSPDLSVPGNCRFYQALGFACFDDADWTRVMDGIRRWNIEHADRPINTLILETHGTNGNGLKLQRSYDPKAERSYISVGALQERLDPDGIQFLILSACNSGRLLRPMILRTLDPDPGDKLFLPATCGIVNASASWRPGKSRSVILTPGASHIETSLVGSVRELSPAARRLIAASAKARGIAAPKQFAVSDMMIQMVLRDPNVNLQIGRHVDELSKDIQPVALSEALFTTFVRHLDAIAARELPSTVSATRKSVAASRRTR